MDCKGTVPDSILLYALLVLQETDLSKKATLTREAYAKWKQGKLPVRYQHNSQDYRAPDQPGRPKDVTVVHPNETAKRGKGGSLEKRIAMIHSFAHIESMAIDLSWDIMLRFHGEDHLTNEFFGDWLKVAWDEARHYEIWASRLVELGSEYGALPVHDGLWESALESKTSLLDRLCIIHMVHEARGLDVTPKSIQRLKSAGDKKSAMLLQEIYEDEITHVEMGVKWFK